MKQRETKAFDAQVYYRIIALWVLCEAMLGGIIHALRIPVSGLIVGGCAVICICLLAYYVPAKGAIIKATIIVAIFKMMLSPQSPPLAYLAVFFQGTMGELFFWRRNFYRLSCLLLGVITLLESGLQRIVVLTIVYGNNFWKAINNSINELTGQKDFTNYSLIVAAGYVVLHLLAGLMIGWWAGIIPGKVMIWERLYEGETEELKEGKIELPVKKKKRWLKKGVFIIWITLVLLYLQSYFKIGNPVLPPDLPLQILIRSVIIVLAWYFVLSPIISMTLKKWLEKKQLGSKQDIQQIVQLLPDMRQLISKSWRASSGKRKIKRIIYFSKIVLARVLNNK